MGKKILDSKLLYMILSILISLSLWIWVTSRDENKERQTFNLPVTFEGVDILEDRGLMIVSQNVTANVQVQATPMILATLNNNPPQLVANVSSISAEGTHAVVYTYRLPSGVSSNDVEFISGAGGTAVNVEVARSLRREGIEIRGEFQGTAAEGYLAGDKDEFRFSPGTLTISGRAELVNQVAYAKVIVTGDDLTEPVDREFPFQLIGASGAPLDQDITSEITCDVDTIYTTFPIRATAEIPLEVKVTPGGGLGVDDVKVELDTDSIVVAGSQEAVDALASLGAITVTSIDLATLEDDVAQNGSERVVPIPLTDELENVTGITEVKVTLKILKRVETREFEIKADRINTTTAPEGWQASIITQVLKVKIRGTAELLDELTEESIWAIADLQDTNMATGQYTVSARAYLNSAGSESDVGVVNPSGYAVVISLAQAD